MISYGRVIEYVINVIGNAPIRGVKPKQDREENGKTKNKILNYRHNFSL